MFTAQQRTDIRAALCALDEAKGLLHALLREPTPDDLDDALQASKVAASLLEGVIAEMPKGQPAEPPVCDFTKKTGFWQD